MTVSDLIVKGSLNVDDFHNKKYQYTESINIDDDKTVTVDIAAEDSKTDGQECNDQCMNLKKPLHVFLKDEENYKAFASYLALCFAIENLFFVEKVVIFYHLVLKCEHMRHCTSSPNAVNHKQHSQTYSIPAVSKPVSDKSTENTISGASTLNLGTIEEFDDSESEVVKEKDSEALWLHDGCPIYGLQFEYLKRIHQEINLPSYLNGKAQNLQIDIKCDDLMDSLWLLCKSIYSQFIDDKASLQINISSDMRQRLTFLMRDENKSKFEHLADFANFYHEVLIEAWQLMESVYCYNFKKYIKSKK